MIPKRPFNPGETAEFSDSFDSLVDKKRVVAKRHVGSVATGVTTHTYLSEAIKASSQHEELMSETVKKTAERIREEARTVAAALVDAGLDPEVSIVRTELKKVGGKIIKGWKYRRYDIEKERDTIPGWILTSAHQLNSQTNSASAIHQGFALGVDGEIYGYTTRNLGGRLVESRFSKSPHGSEDKMPLVYPVQIGEGGVYSEEADVIDKIYAAHGYGRGVEDPANRNLVHGNSLREALANLVVLSEAK